MTVHESIRTKRACLVAFVACLSLGGCASQNDGDVLSPAQGGLTGTWEYLVTNAHQATFTECTGDAAVLEGSTLFEGLSLAPICMTPVTFDVNQAGDSFDVPAHPVICSDGLPASVTGTGEIANPDLGGQWVSVSDQGVHAIQQFTGVIHGNTIQLSELRRTFQGPFVGACDFSPPLTALVTVQ